MWQCEYGPFVTGTSHIAAQPHLQSTDVRGRPIAPECVTRCGLAISPRGIGLPLSHMIHNSHRRDVYSLLNVCHGSGVVPLLVFFVTLHCLYVFVPLLTCPSFHFPHSRTTSAALKAGNEYEQIIQMEGRGVRRTRDETEGGVIAPVERAPAHAGK
ncbi:unnamed protein product [Trypanosoma congolense IL3000]|uniref:WGS project CAEQ00000000 data, annotated contig 123 n=1 Tax=Trypanosoma congolense (strain IL3000) TaxID=1068625 RepID=F9W4V6_TRYCI|nr:unnamed protein product [Trypanosoma congolense IL3000]